MSVIVFSEIMKFLIIPHIKGTVCIILSGIVDREHFTYFFKISNPFVKILETQGEIVENP